MSVVALASAKGSPGVTTTAIALAARWPAPREVVVMELDPAGGDIGAWSGLAAEPGIGSLAAGARRGVAARSLLDHSQRLPGDVRVVVGPPGSEQARRAVTMLASNLPPALGGKDIDVLADCGRLDPQSPAAEVARLADLVVLVTRPDIAALGHLAALVSTLDGACRSVGVLMVGRGPYPSAEVSEAIGAEILGVLPHDPEGAALVAGGRHGSRAARRSLLLRSAGDVAGVVAHRPPRSDLPATEAVDVQPAEPSANGGRPRLAR